MLDTAVKLRLVKFLGQLEEEFLRFHKTNLPVCLFSKLMSVLNCSTVRLGHIWPEAVFEG